MNVEAAEWDTGMRDQGRKLQFTSGKPEVDIATKIKTCKVLKCTCQNNDCQEKRQQLGGQVTLQQYYEYAEMVGQQLDIPPAPDLENMDDPTNTRMEKDNRTTVL